MNLASLKNCSPGETIYVLGSGTSLGFIDPGFFSDKTVISTNYSADTLGIYPQYAFTHYHEVAFDLHTTTGIVVTNKKAPRRANWRTEDSWPFEYIDNLVMIERSDYSPPGSNWNPLTTHIPEPDTLAFGSSSLHGALHLAAHIGASYIVLVGADCGVLDGRNRIEGYPEGHTPWALYNRHHKLMKTYIEENYPTKVYSLNPFINFNLEGHTFEGVRNDT